MVELCKGQQITAYPTGETSYDRIVAKCFLDDGRDLAAEIVKQELALDLPHFPNADYKHLETPAAIYSDYSFVCHPSLPFLSHSEDY